MRAAVRRGGTVALEEGSIDGAPLVAEEAGLDGVAGVSERQGRPDERAQVIVEPRS